jgi:hypothetical protein
MTISVSLTPIITLRKKGSEFCDVTIEFAVHAVAPLLAGEL